MYKHVEIVLQNLVCLALPWAKLICIPRVLAATFQEVRLFSVLVSSPQRRSRAFLFVSGGKLFLPGEIPGMGEPGGLPSMGSHRVGHNRSDLAAESK